MLQLNVSSAIENKNKASLYFSQGICKPLLDSEGFFDRICKALGIDNAYGAKARVAEITGLSKTAIGLWDKGEMPGRDSLQNIAKVSELSGASLHWLLTGEGEKSIESAEKEVSIDGLIEKRMQFIADRTVKNAQINSLADIFESTSSLAENPFTKKESETAKRMKEVAVRIHNLIKEKNVNSEYVSDEFRSQLNNLIKGEIPTPNFLMEAASLVNSSVSWLTHGEGEKTKRGDKNNYAAQSTQIAGDLASARTFVEAFEARKKSEGEALREKQRKAKEAYLRSIFREEIELTLKTLLPSILEKALSQRIENKTGAPSFTIGENTNSKEGNKAA